MNWVSTVMSRPPWVTTRVTSVLDVTMDNSAYLHRVTALCNQTATLLSLHKSRERTRQDPDTASPAAPRRNLPATRSKARIETSGIFICRLCKRSFSKKQSLRRHMNLHSGHRPFQCPFCEYRSSRKDHLQLHMRTRHDPGQSKHYVYKCPICGNSFPSQKRVLTHLKSHQSVHRCEQCDYGFPSLLAYETHKKMKHATVSCPTNIWV